ncbi:MAG: hypothetical protein AAF790_09775 [Planctomycetota bacterium]
MVRKTAWQAIVEAEAVTATISKTAEEWSMEARPQSRCWTHDQARSRTRCVLLTALMTLTALAARDSFAAGYRTRNFVVQAPTRALAVEIGESAERWRRQLAIEWLGAEMPAWSKPCPISARVSPRLGAGGETSFIFDRGQVFGWDMKVQGSRERVLDSVLPHEITHTVFASHFRQPLPRWADEGACTTVEHASEIGKQERMLIRFLKTGRGIAFSDLFAMKDYPPEVMPLYSQGHSVATYLIERRGKHAFMRFLADGLEDENWPAAVRDHYGHGSLMQMQNDWLAWVKRGRPRLALEPAPTAIAAATPPPSTARDVPAEPARLAAAPGAAPRQGGPRSTSVYAAGGNTAAAAPAREGGSVYDASRETGAIFR